MASEGKRPLTSLRCQGLRKSFGGVCVLRDLSVTFPPSGVVALVGPNGAGKTTLLNILTGFLKPDAGQCFYGKIETTSLSPHRIVQLGISRTFQEVRLIQELSVLENVALGFRSQQGETLLGSLCQPRKGQAASRTYRNARRLLREVELDTSAGKLAGQLSYGQQKLLSLASCLSTEPTVLLLDEPVSGVQPSLKSKIGTLLRKLSDADHSVVVVEHDLGFVRELASVVIVMDQGQILAEGCPSEALERTEVLEAYIG